jgi:pyruvate/oxaloacetate carboxyltransferase
MLSNLVAQLKEFNALSKLKEVLDEVPIVRKDLGYPPLVTPMSQIVGTQAVINVVTGKRYGTIIKEVEDYINGFYGKPPGEINKELLQKIKPLNPPKELTFKDIPEDIKALFKKEEDALTYLLFPQAAISFLKGETKVISMINTKEKRKEIKWFKVKIGNEEIEIKIEE